MDSIIRLATEEDAHQIAAIYAPFVLETPVSFEAVPPTGDEMAENLAKLRDGFPWLVCEAGNQIRGYAYASPHRLRDAYKWSVDASVYLHADHRGVGVGSALYGSLFEILRLQGFANVFAGITMPNAGSEGLHRSVGFRQIGLYEHVGFKCGVWHDVTWWQLDLQEVPNPPPLPKSMAEVIGTPAFEAALMAGLPRLR